MSASLVGSEMCIRDRSCPRSQPVRSWTPAAEKAAQTTGPSCPRSTRAQSPVTALQSLAALSAQP
eukprot:12889203-Alexandrium_andersonii.AAC.1